MIPFLLFALGASGFGLADEALAKSKPTEYEVKAAFLFQFANFVEWPAEAVETETFNICLLGEDPFGSYLDAIESRKAKGLEIRLRRLETSELVEGCHLLFVHLQEPDQMESLHAKIPAQGILVVGDSKDFARRGGMIGFIFKSGRVGLELNLDAAREAGLKVSSKLLEVAKVVK